MPATARNLTGRGRASVFLAGERNGRNPGSTYRTCGNYRVLALQGAQVYNEVAELCGVTRRGAYAIMARISRVLPLTLDNGTWYEFHPSEEPDETEERSVPHVVLS